MAKVINTSTDTVQTDNLYYSLIQLALIGLALGTTFWLLTLLFRNLFLVTVAGDLAMIITAIFGIVMLVTLRMVQPLVIATATSMILWGLAVWTNGLAWPEAIIWSALLFGLSYILFSWIARYTGLVYVLVSIIIIIIITARVLISL